MLRVGTVLQERYEIIEKIGSGGMSDVYKAKCHKLNRLVAIKVLKAEFTDDANFVSKFKMEAQAAAGLTHSNIVNIYDVVDEGDIHFIVMELVEGITLKSYITKKGRLDMKEAIGIAIQVAQGIEAAHKQHIIHRDIKPQNMLISKDGTVKVADFGIARAVSAQTIGATVVGSVYYISPEQAKGEYSDERSDIYSLGITMYEMAAGRLPFEGNNTVAVALAHLEEPVKPPSTYNPEISAAFEKIILKCTEKRPEDRYDKVGVVIADLRRALLSPPGSAAVGIVEEEKKNEKVVEKNEKNVVSSDTIKIDQRELHIIQGVSKRPQDTHPARRGREERTGNEPQRRPKPPQRKQKEEATGVEKLLAGLGVLAASLVVIAVGVFLTKIGGFFGRSAEDTTAVTEETTAMTIETEETGETETETEETLSQKEVRMPLLIGDAQEVAEAKLEALDLVMQVEFETSDTVEKGLVLSQEKEADSVVPRYSKVTVTVSSGSNKIDLTSLELTHMTLDTAVRLLEGKGLKTTVTEEASDTEEAGNIIRFEPADRAAIGDTVTLFVSTGPAVETVPMPALEGKPEAEAQELLSGAGLITGSVSREHDNDIPEGHIIRQEIPSGQDTEKGTIVNYTVSLGREQPQTQFLASLEASYPLMVSFGPGAASSEIQILIRLKQTVNGKVTYTKLAEPKAYSADTMLDIRFDNIRGADGVKNGEVEIVDLTNNVVLTSYNVTFTEVQV